MRVNGTIVFDDDALGSSTLSFDRPGMFILHAAIVIFQRAIFIPTVDSGRFDMGDGWR